jgi:hypothetical protein
MDNDLYLEANIAFLLNELKCVNDTFYLFYFIFSKKKRKKLSGKKEAFRFIKLEISEICTFSTLVQKLIIIPSPISLFLPLSPEISFDII